MDQADPESTICDPAVMLPRLTKIGDEPCSMKQGLLLWGPGRLVLELPETGHLQPRRSLAARRE